MAGKTIDPETRFWKYVVKAEEHWWWVGSTNGKYGKISYNGRLIFAHRLSYILFVNKDLPDDINVLHHCDLTLGVKPECLFIGTALDNSLDAKKKGRLIFERPWVIGERNGRAKLTEEQVREIRAFGKEISHDQLCQVYGVAYHVIQSARSGRTFRNVA